jgi:uncharacterized membrane protein
MYRPSILPISHRLALICFYCLLLVFLYSSFLIAHVTTPSKIIIWLIQIIPLLIFCFGLHMRHLRSMIWLSFISLIYFTHGILVSSQTGRLALGLTETLLSSGLFISLVLYIRNNQKLLK